MGRGAGEGQLAAAPSVPPSGDDQMLVEFRQATPADLPALAALYSLAFARNPAYRWTFTGDAEQASPEGALPWLFLRRARMLLKKGCPLLVGCLGGELVAAGGAVPFSCKPGTWDYLMNGIALWPLWWGGASLARGLRMDAGLLSMLGSGPSVAGELSMVAVHPDWQGRGLGSRMLAALLERWDSDHGGGLLLMTQEEYALRLYCRHGFGPLDATHHDSVHPEGRFCNWIMLRPAGQAAETGPAAKGQEAGARAAAEEDRKSVV